MIHGVYHSWLLKDKVESFTADTVRLQFISVLQNWRNKREYYYTR